MRICAAICVGIFTLGLMSNSLGTTQLRNIVLTQKHDNPQCIKKQTEGLCYKCHVLKTCTDEELITFAKCCEKVK